MKEMTMVPRRLSVALALVFTLSGCSAIAAPSPTPPPTAPPTSTPTAAPTAPATPAPAPTPPYVLIKGTDTCTITSMVDRHENGNVVYDEHFVCHRLADDPRVSGTLEFDVTSVFEPMGAPNAQWTSDNYVLTNDGGTWDGTAKGTVAIFSTGGLMNYGRADYVGTGAYDGLLFTELIAATDSAGLVLGYITGQH